MYCSLGTEKPNLTVTSQTFRRIADALVGTEGDNNGMVISQVLEFANVAPRILLVLPPPTRLTANNTERQYQ